MDLRQAYHAAVLASIAASVMMTGCETPTDDASRIRLGDDDRVRSIDTIRPTSSGSTFAGMSDPGPREMYASPMESAYRDLGDGKGYLRAVCEFAIAPNGASVERATLYLTESRETSARPKSPDEHVVYTYLCDYAVNGSDHDRPAIEVARFMTDVNDPPRTIAIDVTEPATMYLGAGAGFRVQLAADPEPAGNDSLGSAFASDGEPGEAILVIERVR